MLLKFGVIFVPLLAAKTEGCLYIPDQLQSGGEVGAAAVTALGEDNDVGRAVVGCLRLTVS